MLAKLWFASVLLFSGCSKSKGPANNKAHEPAAETQAAETRAGSLPEAKTRYYECKRYDFIWQVDGAVPIITAECKNAEGKLSITIKDGSNVLGRHEQAAIADANSTMITQHDKQQFRLALVTQSGNQTAIPFGLLLEYRVGEIFATDKSDDERHKAWAVQAVLEKP